MTEPDDDADFEMGRVAPFAMVSEWVMLSEVSHGAVRAYGLLIAHMNRKRGDRTAEPSQPLLAREMHSSQGSINRFLKELVDIGAIDKRPPRKAGGNCRYVVHQVPPDDYEGFGSVTEFCRAERAERERAQVQLVPELPPAEPGTPAEPPPPPPAPLTVVRPAAEAPPKVAPSPRRRSASAAKTPPPPPAPIAPATARVIDATGYHFTDADRQLLATTVDAALAGGWGERALITALHGFADGSRWPVRVAVGRIEKLGSVPPQAPVVTRAPRCAEWGHESYPADRCPLCATRSMPG